MDIKILFKVFLILLVTALPLQAGIFTMVNLAFSGTLLTAAGISGMQAKKCWDTLPANDVIGKLGDVAANSGGAAKAWVNGDQKELKERMSLLKKATIHLKNSAGPTAGWTTATLICAGFGLKLFLTCL